MLLNSKISDTFLKIRKQSGSIGIEIEAEYTDMLDQNSYNKGLLHWLVKEDGSLRNHGYEYVLRKPIPIKDLQDVLNDWENFVKDSKLKYLDSNRCSVHIHNNVQDFTVLEVITAICAYWLVEPSLMSFCGKQRKGNNFCLGLKDADGVHNQLITNIKTGKFLENFAGEMYRYASLNLEAIPKFGSIEIRTMRGTNNSKEIKTWVEINYDIFTNSRNFKSPQDLMDRFYKHGGNQILKTLIRPEHYIMLESLNGKVELEKLLEENAFYVLEIANARATWDVKLEQNSKKKIEQEVIKLKNTYLLSLGYPDGRDTDLLSTLLARNDLKDHHNFTDEDFR